MKQMFVAATAGFWIVLLFSVSAFAGQAAQTQSIQMGPYFQTLKQNDSIEDAIQRGQELFNKLGCAGCHPRGGTIGGTAVTATGMRMNIPIPALTGAALHYPRIAGPAFIATIGTMNDL
jgi:hypothetical protein